MMEKNYAKLHFWEKYFASLDVEYEQCFEEGKDIAGYKDLFDAVIKLEEGKEKEKMGEAIFDLISNLPQRSDYPYIEPSDLSGIKAERKEYRFSAEVPNKEVLREKILGAWYGRICGCLLGKTVEGIHTDELIPFLEQTGNYPMHRYILKSDISDEICEHYRFDFKERCYADDLPCAPADDDTNYTVLSQVIIKKYGREFTPENVAETWMDLQPKNAYCTAERVAFCNFLKGIQPPMSASYQNPYREWIGAQIRGDYFGYINPGDPEKAAEMAWRDASISHIKNGIYGEMFASAMLAAAAVTDDIQAIIQAGLSQIPCRSRLFEAVSTIVDDFNQGSSKERCFEKIHQTYDEYSGHGWCHTISNAMIVAACLLYGAGDYGASICMAVETGFDTDCNGATVGSILGMRGGYDAVGEEWKDPVNEKLDTAIFGVGRVTIDECADKTLEDIVL